jgi:hypothetical protein
MPQGFRTCSGKCFGYAATAAVPAVSVSTVRVPLKTFEHVLMLITVPATRTKSFTTDVTAPRKHWPKT